jgi:uncharacterized phage protein (TIGR01671 family)
MREIKFRIWDKRLKEMDYSRDYPLLSDFFGETVSEEDQIYMQYTGLKDKNSKEIYEGDILECEFYKGAKVLGEVKWDNIYEEQENVFNGKSSSLMAPSFTIWSLPKDVGLRAISMFPQCRNNIKVIGNIHENPELLNKKPAS